MLRIMHHKKALTFRSCFFGVVLVDDGLAFDALAFFLTLPEGSGYQSNNDACCELIDIHLFSTSTIKKDSDTSCRG
jgi:hypothetical protein